MLYSGPYIVQAWLTLSHAKKARHSEYYELLVLVPIRAHIAKTGLELKEWSARASQDIVAAADSDTNKQLLERVKTWATDFERNIYYPFATLLSESLLASKELSPGLEEVLKAECEVLQRCVTEWLEAFMNKANDKLLAAAKLSLTKLTQMVAQHDPILAPLFSTKKQKRQ